MKSKKDILDELVPDEQVKTGRLCLEKGSVRKIARVRHRKLIRKKSDKGDDARLQDFIDQVKEVCGRHNVDFDFDFDGYDEYKSFGIMCTLR